LDHRTVSVTPLPTFTTITPSEFAERWANEPALKLIDVREPEEWELVRVEGAVLYPMSRFAEWQGELGRDDEIVVMCHHGIRSAHVCAHLVQEGFTSVANLAGGIDRWASEVDPSIGRY
jgi:rhodanese-related sulfurtransferase